MPLGDVLRLDSIDPAVYERVVARMDTYQISLLVVAGDTVLLGRRDGGLLHPGPSEGAFEVGDTVLTGRVIVRRLGNWYRYRS